MINLKHYKMKKYLFVLLWIAFISHHLCSLAYISHLSHASTASSNDGSIDLSLYPGTTALYYQWSTGDTTQDVSNLAPGRYYVNIGYADNCGYQQITIDIHSCDVLQQSSYQPVTADAIIELNTTPVTGHAIASQGLGYYFYHWANAAGDPLSGGVFLPLPSEGTYCVTVTDGCTQDDACLVYSTSNLAAQGRSKSGAEQFAVYPNPASDRAYLQATVSQNGSYRIIISDNRGASRLDLQYHWTAGANQTALSAVAQLSPGQYQMDIYRDKELLAALPLMKVK